MYIFRWLGFRGEDRRAAVLRRGGKKKKTL